MKRIRLLFIALSLLFVPVFAEVKDGYYIDNYNIDFVVNEDNSFDITETIDAFFTERKHGIVREIPLRNKIVRQDGTTDTVSAKISSINVNTSWTSSGNTVCLIKIGNPYETVIEDQTYVIKYHYALSRDPSKTFDEIYFNLIGTKWSTEIRKVTFTIHLPRTDKPNELGFSTGAYGEANTDNITYEWIDEQTIKGSVNTVLEAGEGLTFRATFKEGYFEKRADVMFYVIMALLIVLCFLFSLIIRNSIQGVVKVVNFYPPEGLNSFYTRIAYDLEVDGTAASSILIELASKGYLYIIEKGETDWTVKKLKNYDGTDEVEEKFMNALFEKKKEVNKNDLFYNYKITRDVMSLGHDFKDELKKDGFLGNRIINLIFFAVTIFLYGIYCYGGIGIAPIVFWILSTALFYVYIVFIDFHGSKYNIVIMMFASILINNIFCEADAFETKHIIATITVLLITIWNCLVCGKVHNLTDKGKKLKGEVIGFKEFLELVEKDKLETLVKDNPSYFYDILPYTMALGISKIWVEKFKDIVVDRPEWYITDNYSYDKLSRTFDLFDKYTYNSYEYESRNHYSSSSSSSSSSSGGGFSGGGSGGGGGSS